MLAVVPVRAGALVAGGAECVAECGGAALLVGDGAAASAAELTGIAAEPLWALDRPSFAPAAWAAALAPLVAQASVVVLPAAADGRDLAPRLAHELARPLLAEAVAVHETGAELARHGGLVLEHVACDGPFVATLQPGVRGVVATNRAAVPKAGTVTLASEPATTGRDAEVLEVLPPDVTTMDLTEARRIVAGGAGLDSPDRFALLERLAAALGASMGATRVVTDRGWVGHARQIGTTGVVVDPRLYVAFGISGAVQHTSGLGQPDHIVSVNTDPYCPMMQLADLALVSDANAVLDELAARLLVAASA
ncbi:MAG TPA: mycofactocin-associated electron transfer flavoprotein alpha subunit [Acidimicrobiales bacterium]|nr:mycofactocin-associated electron transfer flavoprotein alpha subunit [Acidimicrobiales bacterium]